MPLVTLQPHPAQSVTAGLSLLDVSEDLGHPLESDCGGVAACNACRVRVISGAQNLSPRSAEEVPFLDDEQQRLGCQAIVLGHVVVRPEPGL
ncbi:MAG: (2Fe-2S)-binding protein [Deltaproteobacteria bacterium]|nr:MAG: (2Fe-2S)-binding protein [Deltaproteobacteria bacterium]